MVLVVFASLGVVVVEHFYDVGDQIRQLFVVLELLLVVLDVGFQLVDFVGGLRLFGFDDSDIVFQHFDSVLDFVLGQLLDFLSQCF